MIDSRNSIRKVLARVRRLSCLILAKLSPFRSTRCKVRDDTPTACAAVAMPNQPLLGRRSAIMLHDRRPGFRFPIVGSGLLHGRPLKWLMVDNSFIRN